MASRAVVQVDLTDVDPNVTGILRKGTPVGRIAFNNLIEDRETDSGSVLRGIALNTLLHEFPDFDLRWDGSLGDESWPKIVAKAGAVGKRVDFSGVMTAMSLTQHGNSVRGFPNMNIVTAGEQLYLNTGGTPPIAGNQKWQLNDTNLFTGTLTVSDVVTSYVYSIAFTFTVIMGIPSDLPELVIWKVESIRDNEK